MEVDAASYYNLFKKHSKHDRSLRHILGNGSATIFLPSNDAVGIFSWPDKNEDQIDIQNKIPCMNCTHILRPSVKAGNTFIYLIDMAILPSNNYYNMNASDDQCNSSIRLII
jgi:uncharacterized surface protein with fasciclin (FAS1) repeats